MKEETINQRLCRIYKIKYKPKYDEDSSPVVTERQRAIERKKMEFLRKIVNRESLIGIDDDFKRFWEKELPKKSNIIDFKPFRHEEIDGQ